MRALAFLLMVLAVELVYGDEQSAKLRVQKLFTSRSEQDAKSRFGDVKQKIPLQDEGNDETKHAELRSSSKDSEEQRKSNRRNVQSRAEAKIGEDASHTDSNGQPELMAGERNIEVPEDNPKSAGAKPNAPEERSNLQDGADGGEANNGKAQASKGNEGEHAAQPDTRVDDLVAAFKLSDAEMNVLRQADFGNPSANSNPFLAGAVRGAAPDNRNARVPTFVDAGDGTFRIVGGPEPDSGTLSVVLIFCFVALLVIAVIFAQQRAAVSAPHLRLDEYAKSKNGGMGRSRGTRANRSGSRGTASGAASPHYGSRFDSNSFEVNVDDGNAYFATRKRVQTDLEGMHDTCVDERDDEERFTIDTDNLLRLEEQRHDPLREEDDSASASGSEYGKLNETEDTAALDGFSEDDSASDVPFDYRTVEDEVDDLEQEHDDSEADSIALGAPDTSTAQNAEAEADWSLDDSDSDMETKKKSWSFW